MRHALISLLGGFMDFLVFLILFSLLKISLVISFTIAFLVATLIGFIGHATFTFKVKPSKKNALLFFAQTVFNYFLGLVVISYLLNFGLNSYLGKIIQLLISFFFNVFFGRFVSFRIKS
jgi:putative flippase GtrA